MMNKQNITLATLITLLVLLIFVISTGCGRPRVGSPGYTDPFEDQSEFEPAEEFEYLADLDAAVGFIRDTFIGIGETMAATTGEDLGDMGGIADEVLGAIGVSDLEKTEIAAEANESMIHASAEYGFPTDIMNIMTGLNDSGAVEVELPAHFPSDRWAGHTFIAKPGVLMEVGFEAIEKSMEDMAAGMGMPMSMNLDAMMAIFFGFESASESYEWMGDECVFFSISNPDFDPEGDQSYENVGFYSVMAISSKSPEDGLDVYEKMFGSMMLLFGSTDFMERGEFQDHDALIVTLPSLLDSPFLAQLPEDQRTQFEAQIGMNEEMYGEMPPLVAVAVDGYVFFADQPSIEAALETYTPGNFTTNRTASIEWEANWDLFIEGFFPGNPIVLISMLENQTPEIQDLLVEFQDAVSDCDELGLSRVGVTVEEDTLRLDFWTSRESIIFYDAIQEVVEETPSTVWEALGRQIGEAIAQQQQGMGGFGGQDFSYDF